MLMGLFIGLGFSVLLWYGAVFLANFTLDVAPPLANGVPDHVHPPADTGLLGVLGLVLLLVPPVFGSTLFGAWSMSLDGKRRES